MMNNPSNLQPSQLLHSLAVLCLLSALNVSPANSQELPTDGSSKPAGEKIVINDTPQATDPATALPGPLRTSETIDFSDKPLTELVTWLRTKTQLNVTIDRQSFSTAHLLPSEPLDDRLDNEPIYLLLDRLRNKNISWTLQGTGIRFHAAEDRRQLLTDQYNVGDLFDRQFEASALEEAIVATIDPSSWRGQDGFAEINVLGDVLFVRQTFSNHRKLMCFLEALRNHGRRTLISDPQQHQAIRQALQNVISFEAVEMPLSTAIQALADQTKIDIRLDRRGLARIRFHERTPVSIQVLEQKLSMALDVFLAAYDLSWRIDLGVVDYLGRNHSNQSQNCRV
jgi:hypothetical protein